MNQFEVLCVTMHQNDFSKIKEMNIRSNVVFANQCDHTSFEECVIGGHYAKMISTETRGVGINRNLALSYATADICLLADDDVVYYGDMETQVLSEFDANPKADVFIFHLETDHPLRKEESYPRTKKWPRFGRLPWGAFRIAFRLSSLKRANVWFSTLFGGGALFPSGEDSIFLTDLRKAGLKIYVSNQTIGSVSFEASTWFTGYDEKFYYGKGAFYAAARPKTAWFWMLYMCFRIKASPLSLSKRIQWMQHGREGYKKMVSFSEYEETFSRSANK